ncbi:MAG: hypothetical protein KKD90_06305 [Candidatus Omnitrophica bacterium]|nr:hypothetical protein [Candidatus Omnitrophota bacterium]
MKKAIFIQCRAALLILLVLSLSGMMRAQAIQLSTQEIRWIGERVFENECASRDEFLIKWNEGEDFLSLGIGHFIWYPRGKKGSFEESFPEFLNYAKVSGEKIPTWLDTNLSSFCPWNSREDFLDNQKDHRLLELREFLTETKLLQAAFIVKRLEDALPLMLKNTPGKNHGKIDLQFNRVASTLSGVYALADYVNFKGLGVTSYESYQGKGWGLLQVLSEMKEADNESEPLREFSVAAKKILEERVNNSPPERNEKKWLPGWQRRIDSYLKDKRN